MPDQSSRYPSEADAAQLVTARLHTHPIHVTRCRTGLADYVYDDERID